MSTIELPAVDSSEGGKQTRQRPRTTLLEQRQIAWLLDSDAPRTRLGKCRSQCAGHMHFRGLRFQSRGPEMRYLISAATPSAIKVTTSSPNNPMRAMPPPDMQTEVIMIGFPSSFVPCVATRSSSCNVVHF